ncbi:hypothetical protein H0H93_012556, partial [Arthromyces matolae]
LYDHPMMHQIRSDDSSADFPLLFPRVKAEPDDDEVNPSQYPASSSSSSVVKRPQSPSPDGHPPAAIKHELKAEDSEPTDFKLVVELQKLEAEGRKLLQAKQTKKFMGLSLQLLSYFLQEKSGSTGELEWVTKSIPPGVREMAKRIRNSLWDIFEGRDKSTFIYIKHEEPVFLLFEDSTNPWDPTKEPTVLPALLKSRFLMHSACAQELLDLGQEFLDKHDTTNTNTNQQEQVGRGALAPALAPVPSNFLVGWQLKIMAGQLAVHFKEKAAARNILYMARDAEWMSPTARENEHVRKVLHSLNEYLTDIVDAEGISLVPESNWSPQKRRRDPQDMATGVSKRQKALNRIERERGGAGN